MALIDPEEVVVVGVGEIDSQHQELIELTNALGEAMEARKDNESVGRILSDLVGRTRSHFAAEERLMRELGYPDAARHFREHERLLGHVSDLERRFREGDVLLSFAIMVELKGWATQHIAHSDSLLGEFLAGKGVS